MRFGRTTLVANVVIIGATLPAVGLPVAAPIAGALPLYEYVSSGPASWGTQSLASELHHHSILGAAHAAAGSGEFALATRVDNGDVGLFVHNASGSSSFHDVTALAYAPVAASDPNVFLDPFGNVDLLYVSTTHRLIMISTVAARSARRASRVTQNGPRPYGVTDLTVLSHVPVSLGLPSVSISGLTGEVYDRSANGDAVAIPLQWRQASVSPHVGAAINVTTATNSPALSGDPVALGGTTTAFAATTNAGHVEYFTQTVAGSPWAVTDVTNIDSAPASTGPLAAATNGTQNYVASLDGAGHVQLFSLAATVAKVIARATPRIIAHAATRPPSWSYRDLTAVIAGSPLWVGRIFLSATTTSVDVAGRAANWGDLYDYSAPPGATTWTSNDVSLDSGALTSAANGVTGVVDGTTLTLFSASGGSLTPHGVGVYAIPSNDWRRAISDGWPIISETGGLGTMSAPWVGFSTAPSLTQSPDFLLGKSIINSKRRETWLSFWTVSGPLVPSEQTAAGYYSHGYLAGQWVAQQIDQYRQHGVNIRPNWVIFDPEGYPDNHSALDAPGGASPTTLAKYAGYWSAMINGWSVGLTQVDPALRPGVYAEQSQYRSYGLTNLSIPVFEAIAFGGGGPIRIAGSNGHNILGYIAFNGTCTPTSTLRAQEHTLLNLPWSGQFNTLQFNQGVYCAP